MRVNGALLAKRVNKNISIIGTVEQVLADHKSFNMKSSDGLGVTVYLQQPLINHLDGLVEVHGIAQSPTSVSCDYYITFPEELAKTYDAALDNEAVSLGCRIPNAWQ